MAESTSALKFDDLMAIVAEQAGYGYRANEAAGLSADEETEIELYVANGYREFLIAYEWSFTRPVTTSVLWATTLATTTMAVTGAGNTTITASAATFYPTMIGHSIVSTNASYVISGYTSSTVVTVTVDASADDGETFQITADGSYRMPDDFGGLLTEVFYQANEGLWRPLADIGVAESLELQMVSTATARPSVCAVNPLAIAGAIGQRFDLLVWRIPDSDYTIRYQYQVLPDKLVASAYPYGGMIHAETLQFACLAAMERLKFHMIDGPMQRNYLQLLALSIKRDQKGARAGSLGFAVNANPNYWGDYGPQARTVTCGGVAYP